MANSSRGAVLRAAWVVRGVCGHAAVLAAVAALIPAAAPAQQPRVLGIDVSAWQGNISQANWNTLKTVNQRDFVFIRSSRGGTTGFYNQSNPNNNNPAGQNTLSQRYDDPYFVQNITRATAAGMYAGPYHFARPDIIASTPYSGGIANTGVDEANHFLEMAGAWMRPGYLLPVFDLEAGQSQRSANQLAQFSIDFSDRIFEVTGVRPIMYINGSYANYLQGASTSLRTQVVSKFPTLWVARYANQNNPDSIPVQTGHPKDTYTPIYGPWDDAPHPEHPWHFWQYASTARLSGYNNGNSDIDVNVAQGGMEFLKDQLVPALWVTNSDGQWTSLANWNSGQTPVAPVQGPGQVARVGPLTLPATRLPGIDDTVILDRTAANVTVTLGSGSHAVRKLLAREALNITGGSLTIGYVPSADSTPLSAQFSAAVSLSGSGSLSVHTLQVDATRVFSAGGTGALTVNTLNLMPHASSPARLLLTGDLNVAPLAGAAAAINKGAGTGASGLVDLGGAQRVLHIADGAAPVDLAINVPVTNGGLTKAGPGTLALTVAGSYTGDTIVDAGTLRLGTASLANSADVRLSSGALLDLNFAGTDVIRSLYIDGESQAAGIWGAVGSGAEFTSSLLAGTGLLNVTTYVPPLVPIPGDFNGDGLVDHDDLAIWSQNFGRQGDATFADGDANGDQNVDGADLLVWQRHLGAGEPTSPAAAGVPEPGTGALALGAAISILWRRRRYGN